MAVLHILVAEFTAYQVSCVVVEAFLALEGQPPQFRVGRLSGYFILYVVNYAYFVL